MKFTSIATAALILASTGVASAQTVFDMNAPGQKGGRAGAGAESEMLQPMAPADPRGASVGLNAPGQKGGRAGAPPEAEYGAPSGYFGGAAGAGVGMNAPGQKGGRAGTGPGWGAAGSAPY